MKAILSCTDNMIYSFFMPLAFYSWKKIGVDPICFCPETISKSMELAIETADQVAGFPGAPAFPTLNIAPDREVTYFQCARLFGAALSLPDDEYLITSDIDMAVFGNVFKPSFETGFVIYGKDLVPPKQYPICYILAQAKHWRKAFEINTKKISTERWICKHPKFHLEMMLGYIQCENMRGNYWAKDQEEAYNKIKASKIPTFLFNRSNGRNQFATQRMDRDGWELNTGIIDAHLPRPGFIPENFAKIKDLFHAMYPDDDLTWMVEYHEKFLKLIG